MPRFIYSSRISCPVEKLFEFHKDARNAAQVLPPGFIVTHVEASSSPQVGEEVRLSLKIFGLIPQHWRVVWAEIKPPTLLQDESKEGPFPVFSHRHEFISSGTGAILTDRIQFEPPLRPLGWLLLPAIYLQLYLIFWWRHRRTRDLLAHL